MISAHVKEYQWDLETATQYILKLQHRFKLHCRANFTALPKPRLHLPLKELLDRPEFDAERDEVGVRHGRRGVEPAVLCVRGELRNLMSVSYYATTNSRKFDSFSRKGINGTHHLVHLGYPPRRPRGERHLHAQDLPSHRRELGIWHGRVHDGVRLAGDVLGGVGVVLEQRERRSGHVALDPRERLSVRRAVAWDGYVEPRGGLFQEAESRFKLK